MRDILQTLIIIILTANTLFADALKDTSDYKYYFYVGEELKDIRGFKAVDRKVLPKGEVRFYPAQDRMLIKPHKDSRNSRYLYINRLNSTSVKIVDAAGWLAPNWKYKLEIKEGDLWAVDIDWETGNLSNERQLTQLGIFGRRFSPDYFYGNQIYFTHSSGGNRIQYKLDIATQELVEAPKELGYSFNYISPSKRYISQYERLENPLTYDFKKQELIPVSIPETKQSEICWANDHTIVQLKKNKVKENVFKSYVDVVNFKTQDISTFSLDIKSDQKVKLSKNMTALDGQRSYNVSPDGTKILYFTNDSYNQIPPALRVFDITKKRDILCEEDFKASLHTDMFVEEPTFEWVSNDKIIYKKVGNLLNQGTWIYDVSTQTKKRITPYVATNIIVLRQAGKIIFRVKVDNSEDLLSCNLDGSELVTLEKNSYKRNQLKPFLN